TKEIKCGEEITVFYGQHYFGENNCECLCATCEKKQRGGFYLPEKDQRKDSYKRPTRSKKTPIAYEDYVPTPMKRSHSISEDDAANKLKVMSIDFICNKKKKKSKEVTIQLDLETLEQKHSPKADSAVSLSPNKDILEDFLDDISDISSVSSLDKIRQLNCIGCHRPLENISEQVGPDPSLIHELATWTWSPSAVFTSWCPKRCPRCERHMAIFGQEWPSRKEKRLRKPKKRKETKRSKASKGPKRQKNCQEANNSKN
ncbi:hypothetical protein BY458DRAFT_489414, partial [Sporodiniella umbellata]